MSDQIAALLAALLLATAVVGYARRNALQPTRAGSVAYATGVIAWGAALFAVWFAWALTAESPGCQTVNCGQLGDGLEARLDGLPTDLFLGADMVDVGDVTD